MTAIASDRHEVTFVLNDRQVTVDVATRTNLVTAFLADHPDPTDDEVREAIAANLCMCTGYHNIVRAVRTAARRLSEAGRLV